MCVDPVENAKSLTVEGMAKEHTRRGFCPLKNADCTDAPETAGDASPKWMDVTLGTSCAGRPPLHDVSGRHCGFPGVVELPVMQGRGSVMNSSSIWPSRPLT